MSKKGQFVLPKEIRDGLGLQEGDELLISLEADRVVLTRPADYARRTRGLLKRVWGSAPEIRRRLERERRSWE